MLFNVIVLLGPTLFAGYLLSLRHQARAEVRQRRARQEPPVQSDPERRFLRQAARSLDPSNTPRPKIEKSEPRMSRS